METKGFDSKSNCNAILASSSAKRLGWGAAGTEPGEWQQECRSHRKNQRVISKREISLCAKPSKFSKVSLKTKTEQPSSNIPCYWVYSWSLSSPPSVW